MALVLTLCIGAIPIFADSGTNIAPNSSVSDTLLADSSLVKASGAEKRGVVIAHDSRNNSREFSVAAARTLAGAGIKTYIFDSLRPTPELSFAVIELGAIAGINITASHNPKEYNGYKAYWEDGAQLPPEHAKTVSVEINKIDIFADVKSVDFDSAVESGKIR